MASREEQREQARRRRLEAERADTVAARRQRLWRVGVFAAAAAALVVVVVLVSRGGGGGGGFSASGREAEAQFEGIPQDGRFLGSVKAPVTLIEFADLQCPVCRAYTLETLPAVVANYVRRGKLRIELEPLAILGPDSAPAARAALAAGIQNKLWQYIDVWYRQQGTENSGYADESFQRKVAESVPGLDAGRVMADRESVGVQQAFAAAGTRSQQLGVAGTPTLFVTRRGGRPAAIGGFGLGDVSDAVDAALKTR